VRHIYAYRITYLLAALIVAAAVVFAWLRSRELVLVPEGEVVGEAITTFRGDRYQEACSACHAELPYLGELAAAEGGRDYLVELFLFGVEGEVVIEGSSRHLDHQSYGDWADDTIAETLNYMLTSWGNQADLPADWEPYRPGEVDAARQRALAPDEVVRKRPGLEGQD
jgi:hypothetical protein